MPDQIVRITRLFSFETAHALENYTGMCRYIHGHSYKLAVTVRGRILKQKDHPKDGMVMDFKELKMLVEREVISMVDHCLILNERSSYAMLKNLKESESKVLLLPFQPSSENLICFFAVKIKAALPDHLQLFSLKLSETEKSYAEWFEDDQN